MLLWAGVHALLYALLTPLWQAPDEPSHVEMACLVAERGFDLRPGDYDPALQQRLIRSLADHDFWRWVREATPDPLPAAFDEDPFLRRAARQVGDEPAWYYAALAPICRLPIDLETQVYLMRLVSSVFFMLMALAVWWAAAGVWPRDLAPVIATTGAAAGLPMLAFIGGAVNNDNPAALFGALTFGCLVRLRQRPGWRLALATLALALLAAMTKKTTAFLLPLAGLACVQLVAPVWRRWPCPEKRGILWQARAAVALMAAGLLIVLCLPGNPPANWIERGQAQGWGRTPAAARTGQIGVRLVQAGGGGSARLLQILGSAERAQARGQTVRFGAWVRAEGDATPMRVTVRDDRGVSQTTAVAAAAWQWVEVTHPVSPDTNDVRVAVAIGAEAGRATVEVDDASLVVVATADGAELLRNGDFEQGARLALQLADLLMGSWLVKVQTAAPAPSLPRSLLYLALLFPGFWGNFGWLQVPLPIPVYAVLAIVCGLAAVGLLLRPSRPDDTRDLTPGCYSFSGQMTMPRPTPRPMRTFVVTTSVVRRRPRRLKSLLRTRPFSGQDAPPGPTGYSPAVGRWLALGLALAVLQVVVLPMWGRDWQPQTRYLNPALVPVLVFFVAGLRRWSARWRMRHALRWYLVGFLCLDLYALFGVLVPHYVRAG